MKVKFEGGPLDGQERDLDEGVRAFYAQRMTDPSLFPVNKPLYMQSVEYRPAYVVFKEVLRHT